MGSLQQHTRADVAALARTTRDLLGAFQAMKTQGQKARMTAWFGALERLAADTVDAESRVELQESVAVLSDLFSARGRSITQPALVRAAAAVLVALRRILDHGSFLSTGVDNDAYLRFIEAAELEDREAPLGVALRVPAVAGTARMDVGVGRLCIARMVDDRLARLDAEDEDAFRLGEAARV